MLARGADGGSPERWAHNLNEGDLGDRVSVTGSESEA